MYTRIHIYFEAIAFLASISVYFQGKVPGYLRTFPPFLLVTLVVEIIAYELAMRNINNQGLYNPYMVLSFTYYFFVLRYIIRRPGLQKLIRFFIWLFFILASFFFTMQGPNVFNTFTFMTGALFIVILCAYYYFELIKFPLENNVLMEPAFWICTGLFFFYSSTIPTLSANHPDFYFLTSFIKYHAVIIKLCNCIFYSLLAIGFLSGFLSRKLR